ncbi:MAG: ferritin-like domain-containing protein [Planctomycetaceae bacterium]
MRFQQLRFDRLRQPPTIHPGRRALRSPLAGLSPDSIAASSLSFEFATRGLHDPELTDRDEAIFLLQAAAEVEHALMVQYLFAAYSLRRQDQSAAHLTLIDGWQETLLQIAREEMAHLATVQNLLIVLGGPLNFEREHSPFTSELYPFRFKLQRLSTRSLAKYVTAERPTTRPVGISDDDWNLIEGDIAVMAKADNDDFELRQVGGIFRRLIELLQSMPLEEFRLDTLPQQAQFADWGYDPEYTAGSGQFGEPLLVKSISGGDAASIRDACVAACKAIADQGEGFDVPITTDPTESHFERFLLLFKSYRSETAAGDWQPVWLIPVNPNTSAPGLPSKKGDMRAAVTEAFLEQGRIENQRSRRWAQLFNLRYRMLLNCLSHFLRIDQPLYDASGGVTSGDRLARGHLLIWTFNEMRRLKKLAEKLVQLPLLDDAGNPLRCGPPFELPYTLNLPEHEPGRWRTHRDVLRGSRQLVAAIQADPLDANDPFLRRLLELDAESLVIAEALANGQPLPAPPSDFQKAVRILEEAVRGFDIGYHQNFWRDRTRAEFVGVDLPRVHMIIDPTVHTTNPTAAPLIRQISKPTGWMPRKRPRIPQERIDALIAWISAGCPDNTPAGAKGLVPEGSPNPEATVPSSPNPSHGALHYEADIKPLFREFDRTSMLFMFDLWKFEAVRDNADAIYSAVNSGGMPCDGAWPTDKIVQFKRWIDDGKQP